MTSQVKSLGMGVNNFQDRRDVPELREKHGSKVLWRWTDLFATFSLKTRDTPYRHLAWSTLVVFICLKWIFFF